MIVCNRLVIVDSEFDAKKGQGERPGWPVCICAIEIDAQGHVTEHRLAAPYPARPPWERAGDPHLTVGFALSAEAGSFLNVGWSFPSPAIDLYAEYMVLHNSEMVRRGSIESDRKLPGPSLIKACARYRVAGMDAAVKDEMRALVYTKTNHTLKEIVMFQDYCLDNDCGMTLRLFVVMLPYIDFLRAPFRGAFAMEMERMRWHGIPIDMPTYCLAVQRAPRVRSRIRDELNNTLGAQIYCDGVFKRETAFQWMRLNGIPIPVHPKTGKYTIEGRYIKSMIEAWPKLGPFYEYRRIIDALKNLGNLEIGADGRNRFWLNPYGTKTGRNNPSTNILGLPHTLRSLIKPPPGMAIAYVDYGAQEIGIAAFLSGDPVLIADYLTGDPYRKFAADALGILNPTDQQRQVYKAIVLGRIYGRGVASIARDLKIPKAQAQRIMDQMHARYPVLNAWLDRITTKAAHIVPITCTMGWSLVGTGKSGEDRVFLNLPMQGNGAELMRLVIMRAGMRGLRLIGCAHDGFFIEAPIAEIETAVIALQEIMRGASRDLLNGFELRADCKGRDIVRYPDRFIDKRELEVGMRHWNRLMTLINEEDENEPQEHPNQRSSGQSGGDGGMSEFEEEQAIEISVEAH